MAADHASCHQVLDRVRRRPRDLARQLARQLVATPVETGEPIIIGLDDTTRRRRGARIRARGICRDPVRSSHGHFATAGGLRRLGFMALTPLPWLPGMPVILRRFPKRSIIFARTAVSEPANPQTPSAGCGSTPACSHRRSRGPRARWAGPGRRDTPCPNCGPVSKTPPNAGRKSPSRSGMEA